MHTNFGNAPKHACKGPYVPAWHLAINATGLYNNERYGKADVLLLWA